MEISLAFGMTVISEERFEVDSVWFYVASSSCQMMMMMMMIT